MKLFNVKTSVFFFLGILFIYLFSHRAARPAARAWEGKSRHKFICRASFQLISFRGGLEPLCLRLSLHPRCCSRSIRTLTCGLRARSIALTFFLSIPLSPFPSLPPSRGAFGYCSRTGSVAPCGRCSGEPVSPARPWPSSAPPPSAWPTRSSTPSTGAAGAR